MESIINDNGTVIKVIDKKGTNRQGAISEIIKWGFSPTNMSRSIVDGVTVYTSSISSVDVTQKFLDLVMCYKHFLKKEIELDDKLRHMAHYVVYGIALNNGLSVESMCNEIINADEETKYRICLTILNARVEYWG